MASKRRKDIKTARAKSQEPVATQQGFLRRWSERKAGAREKLPAASESPKNKRVAPTPTSEPVRPLTDADMLPIDALTENSDYKGFLSPKVSEDLRRLALRKLFHLPAFNIRDGLDDYDEDFATFEAVSDIVTAHERHQLESQQQDNQERLARQEEAAEKPARSGSDGEAATDSSKREQQGDETMSGDSEDNENLQADSDHSHHG